MALAFAVLVGAGGGPVLAETLPIEGAYPAGSDKLAALNSLAFGLFTREDGEILSIELEQRLAAVQVRGAPYFSLMADRGKQGVDGTVTGSANSNVETRPEQARTSECAFRDERNRCAQWREVILNCMRQIVTLNYTVQVEGRRRERVFAVASNAQNSALICPNTGNPATVDTIVAQLMDKVANDLRRQFAPREVREDIRVLEGTDGLQNEARKRFREGIRLTKRNVNLACAAWGEVDQLVPDHAPTLFNLGLCAESRRDYNAAEALYRRVLDINRSERYTIEAIERLERRKQAERQIAMHAAGARR